MPFLPLRWRRRLGLALLALTLPAAPVAANGPQAPPTPGAQPAASAPDETSAPAAEPTTEAQRPAEAETPAAATPASGAAAAGDAEASCAAEVARHVQARYEGVRDLRARFRQQSLSVAFGEAGRESEARGEVVFAKPGRMRWTYEAPEPSVVVSDGQTLWIYDPEAGEVQVMDVGQGFLSGTAIQFLLGEGDLLASFDVRSEDCGADPVRLSMRPRGESTYEQLDLVVDRASGLVQATSVHDLFGNRTDVAFEDVRLNTDPPDSTFRFEPPPGTRVLELR